MAGFEHDTHAHDHAAGDAQVAPPDQVRNRGLMERTFRIALMTGIVGLVIAIIGGLISEGGTRRMGYAYLTAFCFVFSFVVGALVFVLLQHVTRAGWSVTVRRIAESMMATMPLMAVLFIPILIMVLSNTGAVFPWAQPVPPEFREAPPAVVEGAGADEEASRTGVSSDDAATSAYLRSYDQIAAARAIDPDAYRTTSISGIAVDNSGPASESGTSSHPADVTSAIATGAVLATATAAPENNEDGAAADHGGDEVHGDDHGAHHGDRHHHQIYDSITHQKRPYLNAPFFTIRWIVFFAIWILMARALWRWSTRQDQTGDPEYTKKSGFLSAPSLLVIALTVTFAAIDLMMSLNPHWFSTMFGVYYFAGGMVGFLALLTITVRWLHGRGLLTKSVNTEHQHDIGKLTFAFVFFWGYIAFSQYMLIWYGNIPEETLWYQTRGATTKAAEMNPWTWIAVILLFGHIFIPFAGLLSRHVKRREALMVFWAFWLIVVHFMDIWWIVMPEFTSSRLVFGLPEIGFLVGLSALFIAFAARSIGARALVPVRDPRLNEALDFQNF